MINVNHIMVLLTQRIRVRPLFPWLLLVVVLVVSFWLRGRYLWVQGWTHDEAIGLVYALLVNAGYPAYGVTFVGFPPLALLTIQLGVALFGTTLAVRYLMMQFSLVGIAAIFWLFRPQKHLLGLLAGLLAAVFLSFNSNYFHASSSLELEVPAIAMTILSLVLAQQYYTHRNIYWLILSGIAFAFSFTLKSLLVFFPLLIGILILVRVLTDNHKTWTAVSQLAISGGAWLLGVAIPLIIFTVIYDPLSMYQQVLTFRFALRDASIVEGNITQIDNVFSVGRTLLTEYGFLVFGTVAGVILGWRQYRSYIWPWCIWLVLAVALLIWHIPFRSRYSLMVLPPLTVLSGLAVAIVLVWLFYGLQKRGHGRLASIVIAVFMVAITIGTMRVPLISAFSSPFLDPSNYIFSYLTEELQDAIDYARDNTTTSDCIIADDPRFVIAAGRLPPPALSLMSDARLMTNWMIDADSLVNEASKHDCPMVVYYYRRFKSHFPDLPEKLQDIYFLRIAYTDEIVIYTAKKHVFREPTTSFDVHLGDSISLQGIDLTPAPWHSGQKIQLATYWTALKPPDQSYKIYLQLKNEQQETVATFDHFPFSIPGYRYKFISDKGGQYKILPNIDGIEYSSDIVSTYPTKGMIPTNIWPVGNTIREVTTMQLPKTLSPEIYYLYIGMYDPDTLSRLPVDNGQEVSDEYLLISVRIE